MKRMKYKVVKIEEDVDFGCEERNENSPVMAVVILQDEAGKERMTRQVDQMLYDREINEGDTVFFNDRKELEKCGK